MEDEAIWCIPLVIIGVIIYMGIHINTLNKKIEARETIINSCSITIDDANGHIIDANRQLENANYDAYSPFYVMRESLENLTTVDTVENNCFIPQDN